MNEDVLRSIIRGDEAEALIGEKFNLSGASHLGLCCGVVSVKN
jgi:hypothetical protein